MTDSADTVDLRRFAAFAGELAATAANVTLAHFRAGGEVIDKSDGGGFDPVTHADRAAEKAIRDMIAAHWPEHGVQGEEFDDRPARSRYTWTLDPIDGTRAFIAGIPLWTTLIALSRDGEPVLGLVDQPYLGERFIGFGGRASFARGSVRRPLRVRACDALTAAVVSTTDPALFDPAEAAAFEQVRRTARLARYGCDAYAYMMLAAGTIDLVAESGLKPHDVRALVPIVTGAGGSLTNWRGEPSPDEGQIVAAGDGRVLNEALVALKRSAR